MALQALPCQDPALPGSCAAPIEPRMDAPPHAADAADCARCGKPSPLCVCAGIEPIANRVALLILQHPQEQDRELGTARLAVLHLNHATLRVGLSWPSLAKALGRPVDPKRWAVLYLGSATGLSHDVEIAAVDAKGKPLPKSILDEIEGVVALDGSWGQAKTLWWRNPWVLKCRRIVLNPTRPSRYGRLRREPRREGLSTLEAAALALARIGTQPQIETALVRSFEKLIAAYRDTRSNLTKLRRARGETKKPMRY
jgi:DTW domain-containing protein